MDLWIIIQRSMDRRNAILADRKNSLNTSKTGRIDANGSGKNRPQRRWMDEHDSSVTRWRSAYDTGYDPTGTLAVAIASYSCIYKNVSEKSNSTF